MKEIIRNSIGMFVAIAAILTLSQAQSSTHDVRLSDIKAQQPQETIFASALCKRALNSTNGWVTQPYVIDPKTLVPDLNSLLEKSDEVILAGLLDHTTVLSPSGESTATYYEVKVVRSWKGPHRAGDVFTFGLPYGILPCEQSSSQDFAHFTRRFSVNPEGIAVPVSGPYAYLLFLRESKGTETRLVQGLRLTAGEGVQGMFVTSLPGPSPNEPERPCSGTAAWSVQKCDEYLETSQSPVYSPYTHDPLATKYNGVPVSSFLQELQSLSEAQDVTQKSPER